MTHSAANLDVVTWLHTFTGQRGIAFSQLAMAWAISNPAVNVAIVCARRASQLEALTPAADVDLSADHADAIDAILSGAAPVAGPAPEGMSPAMLKVTLMASAARGRPWPPGR